MVFLGTKAFEGVLVALVDGRTRQAEEKGIGQCRSHALTEVAFLRAMGFIHQDDNVFPHVERLLDVAKQEDGSDQYLALVLLEESLQFFFRIGKIQVRNLGTGEVTSDLSTKVATVVDDDRRGGIQFLLLHQHLGCKHHEPRLTRALEVPNQALLRAQTCSGAIHHTVDDGHTSKILLIAAHHLDFS